MHVFKFVFSPFSQGSEVWPRTFWTIAAAASLNPTRVGVAKTFFLNDEYSDQFLSLALLRRQREKSC